MAGAPWFLLAAGIGFFVIGVILSRLLNPGSGRVFISAKMSDEEVERKLNQSGGNPLGSIIALVGVLAVFVSIVWRIVRVFV